MKRSYRVTNDQDGQRIDKWFKKNISNVPQSLIEKFLRVGKIKINKKKVKSSQKIKLNNIIEVFDLKLNTNNKKNNYIPTKKNIKDNVSSIVYENEDYIVINKKSGIAVQGGTKIKSNLVDIFAKSKIFEKDKPYTVHRLDKETSGILIFAKNRKTAQFFTSLFRLRKIHKIYLSICHGEFKNKRGELIHNLERFEKNKKIIEKAITQYRVIEQNLGFSLVEMRPITGRKHQLRKQTSIIGHPVVGDNKYSFFGKSKKSLMLHAFEIKFLINKKKINFTAKIPKYFHDFLNSKKINLPGYLKSYI